MNSIIAQIKQISELFPLKKRFNLQEEGNHFIYFNMSEASVYKF